MGKYTGLKGSLPRVIGHEPPEGESSSWNDEVVKLVGTYEAKTGAAGAPWTDAELASAYSDIRDQKDDLEREGKELAKHVEALERILVRRLEEKSMSGIALEDGQKFDLDDKPAVSVTDPDAFVAFIKAEGMGHLLTVHANTRKALATERFQAGITETPGLELKLRTTIKRRKK